MLAGVLPQLVKAIIPHQAFSFMAVNAVKLQVKKRLDLRHRRCPVAEVLPSLPCVALGRDAEPCCGPGGRASCWSLIINFYYGYY